MSNSLLLFFMLVNYVLVVQIVKKFIKIKKKASKRKLFGDIISKNQILKLFLSTLLNH